MGGLRVRRAAIATAVLGAVGVPIVIAALFLTWITPNRPTRLAKRLVASGELIGLSAEEAAARVGQPLVGDNVGKWDEGIIVGLAGGLGPEYIWIVFDLDEEGRIVRVETMTD